MEQLIKNITKEHKKLLSKICKKIMDHPKERKYRNLNNRIITNTFTSLNSGIDLLLYIGFERSEDGKRLMMDDNHIEKVKKMYFLLTTEQEEKSNDADINNINNVLLPKIIELMRMGFSLNDAELAVVMSLDSNKKINDSLHMDEAVQCLIYHGFDRNESMNAIVSAKYDIKKALEILIHKTDTATTNNQQQKPLRKDDKKRITVIDEYAENNEKNEKYDTLVSMGFEKEASMKAIKLANFELNVAVEYLINNNIEQMESSDCGTGCEVGVGSMKYCKHLLLIKETLTKYNSNLDIISTLDSFHHLLTKHDTNQQFEEIFLFLGKCDVLKCNKLRRNRRQRNRENDTKEKAVCFIDDILDKIHCHFHHSYDVGFRLNENERKQIQTIYDEQKYEDDTFHPQLFNKKLFTMQNIIKSKKDEIDKVINNDSLNKFNAINNDNKYSFGERYFYWNFMEEHKNDIHWIGYKECRIHPKFQSLKEELISNPFCSINPEQWDNEYMKAVQHKQSRYGKQLIADPETKMSTSRQILADGRIFGIRKGSEIGTHHLIAIIVYCGYTNLSYQFRATYRRLDKDATDNDSKMYMEENVELSCLFYGAVESTVSIKGRHCKFYHLAKCLNELVHVYSPRAFDGNIDRIYHGINQKMKFDGMRDHIYQPFSTTISYEVAVNFSANIGMILELCCDVTARYFDCAWISDFSNERELLFINSLGTFKFINIIDASTAYNYYGYVQCLFVFDSVFLGRPLMYHCLELESANAKYIPIDPELKMLTLKLMKHELHRYEPKKYNKMDEVDKYIEGLLHFMCLRKRIVLIDWQLMVLEMGNVMDRYFRNMINGYLFSKSLIFKKHLEMIDLEFISLLFPNVVAIRLLKCPPLSTNCFDYILHFLTHLKCTKIGILELKFDECKFDIGCQFDTNQMINKYYGAFQKIGWILTGGRLVNYYHIYFRRGDIKFKPRGKYVLLRD